MSEQLDFVPGIQRIEARTAELLAEKDAAAAVEAEQAASFAKQDEIEARLLSPEMRALNDAAELAMFGSHGRTEGYVDPSTGARITEPIKGKIDEIREDSRYGKGQTDRDAAAAKYTHDADALINDGLELTQAKIVMDRRESWAAANAQHSKEKNLEKFKRKKKMDGRLALIEEQYIKDGLDPEEAHTKALMRVSYLKNESEEPNTEKIDIAAEEARLKHILKTEGIFTEAEYDAFINGDTVPAAEPADADTGTAGAGEATAGAGETYKEPESQIIRYKASEAGYIDFTKEFTADAAVIDWSKLPEAQHEDGLEMVVETESGARYLVEKNEDDTYEVCDIVASQRDGEHRITEYEESEAQPPITIGQPWQWKDGHTTDGPVKKVEVLTQSFFQTEPGINDWGYHKEREKSPFAELDEILAAVDAQANGGDDGPEQTPTAPQHRSPRPPAPTPLAPRPRRQSRAKRVRNAVTKPYYNLGARRTLFPQSPEFRKGRRLKAIKDLGLTALVGMTLIS
jgi:hypothetical protein